MAKPHDIPPPDNEEPDDLLLPEEFARHAFLSTAFVRLVIDCGCPTANGRLSRSMFVAWLSENFPAVRVLAGLSPRPSPDAAADKKEWAALCVDGYLRTIIEFAASRSSDLDFKQACADIVADMECRRANRPE
ncbi:MAG: hypothetical protein V4710_17920 [Verrucomicrobiota bacterium]